MSYVPKYLSEPSSIKHVNVDLQLEGVATKKDLEGITHVDTSSFALKTNLPALKTEVDKLDIPKVGTLSTDVAKLTNKVANDLVEKTDFNSWKTKVDNNESSNSSHLTNKTQNIYVLGKDFVQGINNTTIYAENIYKTNFIEQSKKFVLSLRYNGDNSYLFVNGSQELKFKSSVNYLDRNLLCVGNFHQTGH